MKNLVVRWRLLFSLSLVGCVMFSPAAGAAQEWRAGVARSTITPEERMWLSGFADRTAPADGKLQDLFAKAVAFQDAQEQRFVIVTTDLIGIPLQLRTHVEKHLAAKHALPPAAVLLNASHTHCGPELLYGDDVAHESDAARVAQSRRYIATLEKKLTALIDEALADLRPAQLSYFHARCGFAMNRRLKSDLPTGDPYLNRPNPDGVVDHDVPVLKVTSDDGRVRAILFGYACHNTTMKGSQYSGDYAGYAQEFLEQSHPGATALFVMGCGGDQNGYPRFGEFNWSAAHGKTLATAVEAALQTEARPVRGSLVTKLAAVPLAYASPPTREQLAEKLKLAEKQTAAGAPFNNYERQHFARLLRQYETRGDILREYPCLLQSVRFGDDLLLVALPGEPVVDYSLRLKRELAGPAAVWIAGYSNDVFAYIPSRRVLLEGGYEASRAMLYFTNPLQPGPFQADVEERIIGQVHELVGTKKRLAVQPAARQNQATPTTDTAPSNATATAKDAPPRQAFFPDAVVGGCRAVSVTTSRPLIHTAQVLPLDANGAVVGTGDAASQVRQVAENLAKILSAADSDLAQIVKLNVYVREAAVSVAVQQWLAKNYPLDEKPAVSFVATRLPQDAALVAMDAVALTKSSKPQSAASVQFGAAASGAPSSRAAFGVLPAGPRLYISGQAEKGDGTLADATQKTLESLVASLKFCGLDRQQIVQIKAFCLPMTNAAVVEKTVATFFAGTTAPPLILVEWKSSLPIEIELIATAPNVAATAPGVEYLTPTGMPKSPIFSRAARINSPRVIYVGGLFTGQPGRSAEGEVRALFPLLKETLAAAGSDLEQMAKATYYVADGEVSGLLNKIRPEHYHPERPPAASKAEVAGSGLAGHRITIDMIAVPK